MKFICTENHVPQQSWVKFTVADRLVEPGLHLSKHMAYNAANKLLGVVAFGCP